LNHLWSLINLLDHSINRFHDNWSVDGSLNNAGLSLVLDGVNDSIGNLRLEFDWFKISTVFYASIELLNGRLVTNELRFQFSIDGRLPAGNSSHHGATTISIACSAFSLNCLRTCTNKFLII